MLTHDDVIDQFDLEQMTSFPDARSQLPICLTWGSVSRRMIVHEDEAVSSKSNQRSEDLSGMSHGFVEGADADQVDNLDVVLGVQRQDMEMLLLRVKLLTCADVLTVVGGDDIR